VAKRLDEAGRRELVRLMVEDGLSPRDAAARLGVSESTARRWRARLASPPPVAPVQDPALALAERSIREAQALVDSLLVPVAPRPRPPAQMRRRPSAPPRRRVPAPVRALRWTRRQAGGVAVTIAFIPLGWVAGAALTRDDEASTPASRPGAPAAGVDFSPRLARASTSTPRALVAHARGSSIAVYRRPAGRPRRRLRARVIEGRRVPLVMLVDHRGRHWIRVHLPVRPNQSLGWVRARDVKLRSDPYRLRIELGRHRLTAWRGRDVLLRARIGVGQSVSPTPTGRYFITDLIRARDPDGLYGPYAFGLSAFSPVYTSFGGGPGQIGLHGTNQPEALGTDVSAGCIRVENKLIRRLARILPLGTPVVIRR
jgi:hypothetical protein